jgi:hypothetical protein
MIRTPARIALLLFCCGVVVRAHSGPPFPIVSNHVSGPYSISIWTDPDTTDDGTAGGQFWIVVDSAKRGEALPAATTAHVTIRPLDRPGPPATAAAAPEAGNAGRQFAALVMDHEGRYAVHVVVDGPSGRGEASGEVDATYDLRPPPVLIAVYLLPFVALGALWVKVLLRRRGRAAR